MKLVDQLNALSNETANITNRLKTIISEKLISVAPLGGTSTHYTFQAGTSTEVRQAILTWLKDEGLSTYLQNDYCVEISWGKDSALQKGIDLKLAQLKMGRDHVVYRATFDRDSDISEIISNLKSRGYQVQYDELPREIIIRKKDA